MDTYKALCDCKQMFFLRGVEDATCDQGLGHRETQSYIVHVCGDGEWEDLPAREHYHVREMDMQLLVPYLVLIPNGLADCHLSLNATADIHFPKLVQRNIHWDHFITIKSLSFSAAEQRVVAGMLICTLYQCGCVRSGAHLGLCLEECRFN